MAIHIAPGVYSEFRDIPTAPEAPAGTTGLFIFASSKGVDNELVPVNGAQDLISKFGTPLVTKYGQSQLNAVRYATESSSLYVMRVLPTYEEGKDPSTGKIDSSYCAKYAHVIFGIFENNDKYAIVPFYLAQDNTPALSNEVTKLGDTEVFTKFLAQTFEIVENGVVVDVVKHNLTTVLGQEIDLEEATLTNLNNDDVLKSTWTPGSTDATSYWYNFEFKNPYKPFMVIAGKGRGAYYNNIGISIVKDVTTDDEYYVKVKIIQGSTVIDAEEFKVSFDPEKKDPTGESMFIADVLNKYSDYVTCYADKDLCKYLATTTIVHDGKAYTIIERLLEDTMYAIGEGNTVYEKTTVRLRNGTDGALFKKDGSLDITVYQNCLIHAFNGEYDDKINKKEESDFSLVYDASFPIPVKQAIVNLCERRKDCFGILDLPPAKDAFDAVNVRNNQMAWCNSWLCAIYAPYSVIYDAYSGGNRKVAPSYHMSYIYPRNDRDYALWYAPAGLTRGVASDCLQLQWNAETESELEKFVLNRINPIIKKRGVYVVWGQRTALKKASPFADVNVVRLVLYIDKVLQRFCDEFIFEFNDPITWNQISSGITSFLADLKSKRALYDFSVDVGATDYEIKTHKCHVNVYLKPTRVIEVIQLVYTVE